MGLYQSTVTCLGMHPSSQAACLCEVGKNTAIDPPGPTAVPTPLSQLFRSEVQKAPAKSLRQTMTIMTVQETQEEHGLPTPWS